jgi:uncharacterized protein YndB with AHSA1/START domain
VPTEDRIERELVLPVGIARVWEALTDPGRVSEWFDIHTEIDLRPGGAAAFGSKKDGRFRAIVEEVEPPQRFVYRWCLDRETPVGEGPTTRVEFTLEEVPEGTRLHLVESGFASLPEGVRDRHLADNVSGWDESMRDLAGYLSPARSR